MRAFSFVENLVTADATTEVPQQEAPDEEADLAAGFSKAQGTEPSPEAKPADKATESADATPPAQEPPQAEDPPAPGPLIAGMTEAEVKSLLGKAGEVDKLHAEIRKNFGQIGEMNRTIQEFKTALAAGSSARKPITAAQLKRLSADFPDLAEAIAQDFSEIDTATAAAQSEAKSQGTPFDPEAYFAEKVGPALEQAEARANRNAEIRILRYAHPDYQTVLYADVNNGVYTPEFEAWRVAQPPERQRAIQDSEDAIEIAGIVSEFKAHRAAQAKAAKSKQTRLENAVAPQAGGSTPPPAIEDEDALMAKGFARAKGR